MMIAAFQGAKPEHIDTFFKNWINTKSEIPQISNVTAFLDDYHPENHEIMKFQQFEGSWRDYKKLLKRNDLLSRNFEEHNGDFKLKKGYHPQWELKDFR